MHKIDETVTALRSALRSRERNGRPQRCRHRDAGTPEQQRRRRLLVGSDAPPEAAACPLTLLAARGQIDAAQLRAGLHLGRIYRLGVDGRIHARIVATGVATAVREAASEAELEAARAALPGLLQRLGSARAATVDLAVFDLYPDTAERLAAARRGLALLAAPAPRPAAVFPPCR